jgi:hypothetical protein
MSDLAAKSDICDLATNSDTSDLAAKSDISLGEPDVPELNVSKRNPRLYELVAQDTSSFWWDSVDAKDNPMFGACPQHQGDFIDDFETELSMSVYEGTSLSLNNLSN